MKFDEKIVEKAILYLLRNGFGVNMTEHDMANTPGRMMRMYKELLSGYYTEPPKIKLFPAPNRNVIAIDNIQFFTMCEHHGLVFFGWCNIHYAPDKHIAGLSKFARVVRYFSHKFQIQERLGQEICDYLYEEIKPQSIKVELHARHLCAEMRGVRSERQLVRTMAVKGQQLKLIKPLAVLELPDKKRPGDNRNPSV